MNDSRESESWRRVSSSAPAEQDLLVSDETRQSDAVDPDAVDVEAAGGRVSGARAPWPRRLPPP